jgi:hypothetical protein
VLVHPAMLKEVGRRRAGSRVDATVQCVRDATDDLRSVLRAFGGLPFLGLLPGQSAHSPISETATVLLTSRNIPNVIATLRIWQRVHPLGAFEVTFLILKLEALRSALATQDPQPADAQRRPRPRRRR